MPKRCPCTDHLGNQFPTTTAMCEHWGVPRATYNSRLRKGWSVEEALTDTGPCKRFIPCTDHTGRKFTNLNAMCRAWYITKNTYHYRRNLGWTVEEALTGTGRYRGGTPCTDHEGNTFPSQRAMCEAWGISPKTFSGRVSQGMNLEQALTKPRSKSRKAAA